MWRLAQNFAHHILAGSWTREEVILRAKTMPGLRARKTLERIARQLFDAAPKSYSPTPFWIVLFLLRNADFARLAATRTGRAAARATVATPTVFAPHARFVGLGLPAFATPRDLASWLALEDSELDWFADSRRQQWRTAVPILRHYRYSFIPKRFGPPRLLEEPKPRLKAAQRKILNEILSRVPIHPTAHGFARDRSIVTAAQVHASEDVLVTVDLKDFFASVDELRLRALFRSLGYPYIVACHLVGLVTTATPPTVFERDAFGSRIGRATRARFFSYHLPQGAPTSPALANLAAFRLDARLSSLTRSLGGNYTRYADDLAFSGDEAFAQKLGALFAATRAIVEDEGFAINDAKTKIMRRGGRQRMLGLVVNERVAIDRRDYDRLKAILTNCLRHGPESQNRDGHRDFQAHLRGRVAFVESIDRRRGEKLAEIFARVRW